jgi:spore germination protein
VKANKHIFIILLSTILLSGCVEKEILDDVNLERAVAIDYLEENKILGSVIIPVYLPDQSVKNVLYSASSTISRDFMRDMQRQSEQPLVTGSLELGLFSDKLAKRGIIEIVDYYQRDASIGSRIFLAVVDGEAKDILEGDYGERGKAIYISNLITHNIKSRDLPDTNLQLFLFDYYQRGRTAFLPQMKKIKKDKVAITGVSLFKKGKVVDTVKADDLFYFKLMVDKYSEGYQEVDVEKHVALIRNIRSKHKLKLTNRNPYEITMNIKIKGAVLEYTGSKFSQKELKEVEKALENKVNKKCEELVKRFQEKEIDPVGFGHFAKTQTRNFDFKKWNNDYKNVKVTFNTDVVIVESGVIE